MAGVAGVVGMQADEHSDRWRVPRIRRIHLDYVRLFMSSQGLK